MVEIYSKEVVKEFALQRLRLTPFTLGKCKDDVPLVVRDIGGLQEGGHKIELFNRFEDFESEWFDYWYENYILIDGHVLRGLQEEKKLVKLFRGRRGEILMARAIYDGLKKYIHSNTINVSQIG